MFCKKGILRNLTNFTGKHLYQSLFFDKEFSKKETLAQVFSCEFCQISQNTFLHRTPLVAASGSFYSCVFTVNLFHAPYYCIQYELQESCWKRCKEKNVQRSQSDTGARFHFNHIVEFEKFVCSIKIETVP